jgi:hypothetical protein
VVVGVFNVRGEVEGEVGEDLRGGLAEVFGLLVVDSGKVTLQAVLRVKEGDEKRKGRARSESQKD